MIFTCLALLVLAAEDYYKVCAAPSLFNSDILILYSFSASERMPPTAKSRKHTRTSARSSTLTRIRTSMGHIACSCACSFVTDLTNAAQRRRISEPKVHRDRRSIRGPEQRRAPKDLRPVWPRWHQATQGGRRTTTGRQRPIRHLLALLRWLGTFRTPGR